MQKKKSDAYEALTNAFKIYNNNQVDASIAKNGKLDKHVSQQMSNMFSTIHILFMEKILQED